MTAGRVRRGPSALARTWPAIAVHCGTASFPSLVVCLANSLSAGGVQAGTSQRAHLDTASAKLFARHTTSPYLMGDPLSWKISG